MHRIYILFLGMHKYLIICLCIFSINLQAQSHTILDNGSFEGEPQDATTPIGWYICTKSTTPDILPGPWGVYLDPMDGDSYVGMITRSDGSFESIGQRLSQSLEKGNCYQFSVDLAHSDTYVGYFNPVKIRIWGAKKKCGQDQLLFESELIEHLDWERYLIKFEAETNIKHISIEAYWPERDAVMGNILIDNISKILNCDRT